MTKLHKTLLAVSAALLIAAPTVASAQGNGLRAAWRDFREEMYNYYGQNTIETAAVIAFPPANPATADLFDAQYKFHEHCQRLGYANYNICIDERIPDRLRFRFDKISFTGP